MDTMKIVRCVFLAPLLSRREGCTKAGMLMETRRDVAVGRGCRLIARAFFDGGSCSACLPQERLQSML